MSALAVSLLASCFGALSNLFFRKNSLASPSQNGYLFCYYLVTFVFSFLLFPNIWDTPFSLKMTGVGAIAGSLNVAVMLLTAKALERGPSGLTFAFQNVSSIFPGLLLFLFFGAEFGFSFSKAQAIGLCLVAAGLFLGCFKANPNQKPAVSYLFFGLSALVTQMLVLSVMQWRCLLFDPAASEHPLVPFTLQENEDVWFMPGQFGISVLIQGLIFFSEKRKLLKSELKYSACAGVSNCLSTGLLLFSTKLALPVEQALLFPCFAVTTIILCNLWAKKLYNEKFNITSNMLCSAGILIGIVR